MKFPACLLLLVNSSELQKRTQKFKRSLSQVTESWTCSQPDMRWRSKRSSHLLATATNDDVFCRWVAKGRKTSADLPVKVPGNTIDLHQSECSPLQFFTCTNDPVWPILKKKQLKSFIMKQTSLPESKKFVRAEQGGKSCGGGIMLQWTGNPPRGE